MLSCYMVRRPCWPLIFTGKRDRLLIQMETGTMNEGTKSQDSASIVREPHQRLWWAELARGLIACAFGLLFLTARSFAPHLFMYSLGTYLAVDGALELVDAHRRKGLTRLKAHDWTGGAMSLLAGLLILAFPTVTLLLVAGLIAIRLFVKALAQGQVARRTRGSRALLIWASCGIFVLPGLFLLLLPQLAITLLVVFLGGYMLASGLYLLPPLRTPGFRPWEELTLMWEMMIGHLLTLWVSGVMLATQRWRSNVPSLSPDTPAPPPLAQKTGEPSVHNAAQDPPSL